MKIMYNVYSVCASWWNERGIVWVEGAGKGRGGLRGVRERGAEVFRACSCVAYLSMKTGALPLLRA